MTSLSSAASTGRIYLQFLSEVLVGLALLIMSLREEGYADASHEVPSCTTSCRETKGYIETYQPTPSYTTHLHPTKVGSQRMPRHLTLSLRLNTSLVYLHHMMYVTLRAPRTPNTLHEALHHLHVGS